MTGSNKKRTWAVLAGVALVAVLANSAVGLLTGLGDPLESDAYYYYQLADSLAHGNGYVVRDGFWPEDPSMRRMPGWPFMASLAMRIFPDVSGHLVMRGLCLLVNALAAVLLAGITLRIFPDRPIAAWLAGLAYIVHPSGLLSAAEGLSEPAFVVLTAAGVLLLLNGLPGFFSWKHDRKDPPGRACWLYALCGFLLLGLACLVRANFILWIGCFGLLVAVGVLRRLSLPLVLVLLLGAGIFAAPSLGWALRNHQICGHFPVFSTLRGQTFYGGNNPMVLENPTFRGYWIFPNSIPGETPMVELAKTMNEYEVDTYYYQKGRDFIEEHRSDMPRLLAWKLTRAYLPIPWSRSGSAYAMNAFRALFMLLAVTGLIMAWRQTPPLYRAMLAAMVISNVATVLIFYGYSRFAFVLEAYLVPYIGIAATNVLGVVRKNARVGVTT